MPRTAVDTNNRFAMRIRTADKARLMRAASLEHLEHTDLKDFMLCNALHAAEAVIERAERVVLSERDTRLWLDLLDKPPQPNAKLIAVVKTLRADR